MRLNTVFKIGGSLGRSKGLAALCRELGPLGRRHPVLVVPGGGEFADLVRKYYREYELGETAAHHMALLAMDQYGCLLNRLIEGSRLETEMVRARQTAESGRVAVFLPSTALGRTDPLPHSWDVTSDSIAAWIACALCCARLVLVKDVDGLSRTRDPADSAARIMDRMTVGELARHSGGVDPYLGRLLQETSLVTWIVNGLHPERVSELLDSGKTTGTRIIPHPDYKPAL
ncbi:MAG: hypothetical protein JW793_10390 [Acidobacteria bacterium]|nr:hypothetical protein [Acidobacteriota bacterium]